MVLDEGHKVKNHQGLTLKNLKYFSVSLFILTKVTKDRFARSVNSHGQLIHPKPINIVTPTITLKQG